MTDQTTIAVKFYQRTMYDGTHEVLGFFENVQPSDGSSPWSPCISVWLDDGKTAEDTITVNGVTYAFCIAENTDDEYENLYWIGDLDCVHHKFAIGLLVSKVI